MFFLGEGARISRPEAKFPRPIVRPPEPDFSPEDARDAIRNHRGNLTSAAASLDVPRWLLWDYVRRRPDLLTIVEEARQATVKLAEDQVRSALQKKQDWAIDHVLETFGQNRADEPLTPEQSELLKSAQQADGERGNLPDYFGRFRRQMGWSEPTHRRRLAPDETGTNNLPAEYVARRMSGGPLRRLDQFRQFPDQLAREVASGRHWVAEIEAGLRERIDGEIPCALKFVLTGLGHVRGYRAPAQKPPPKSAPMQADAERPAAAKARAPAPNPTSTTVNQPTAPTEAPVIPFEELVLIAEIKATDQAPPTVPGSKEPDFVQLIDKSGGNVIPLLARHIGNLSAAAASLGVTRRQLIDYVLLRPQLQAMFQDKREELIDHAESKLHELVRQKKRWAIRLVLKFLRQARGYPGVGAPDAFRLTREDLYALEKLHGVVYGAGGKQAGAKPGWAQSAHSSSPAATPSSPAAPQPAAQCSPVAPRPEASSSPVAPRPEAPIDESRTPVAPQPVLPVASQQGYFGQPVCMEHSAIDRQAAHRPVAEQPATTLVAGELQPDRLQELSDHFYKLFGDQKHDHPNNSTSPPNCVPSAEKPHRLPPGPRYSEARR